MRDLSTYPVTFAYGAIDGQYYGPYGSVGPYHRGEDRACPIGTPVLVNGIRIGLSGNTGVSSAPHCHIGRFVAGKDTDPGGNGLTFKAAQVTQASEDSTNGKFVRLQADGASWVYLHLSQQSVSVGQVLPFPAPQPVTQQGDEMITDSDNEYGRWAKLGYQIRGRQLSRAEFQASAVGQTWLHAMEILSDNAESDAATHAQETGLVAVRDNWEGQIYGLKDTLNKVQQSLSAITAEDNADKQQLQDALQKIAVLSAQPNVVPPIVTTTPASLPASNWLIVLLRKFGGK